MDVWRDKIEPRLEEIEDWSAEGVTETDCATNLRIDRKTWAKYRKAKKPLQEALHRGRLRAVRKVRHALMEAALGGQKEELRVYVIEGPDGKKKKTHRETRKYYLPPNVHACNLLLRNLDENWTELPSTLDLEKKRKEENSAQGRTDKEMTELATRIATIAATIDKNAKEIGIHDPSTPVD